jgi:hypothetical protein
VRFGCGPSLVRVRYPHLRCGLGADPAWLVWLGRGPAWFGSATPHLWRDFGADPAWFGSAACTFGAVWSRFSVGSSARLGCGLGAGGRRGLARHPASLGAAGAALVWLMVGAGPAWFGAVPGDSSVRLGWRHGCVLAAPSAASGAAWAPHLAIRHTLRLSVPLGAATAFGWRRDSPWPCGGRVGWWAPLRVRWAARPGGFGGLGWGPLGCLGGYLGKSACLFVGGCKSN